MFLNDDPSSVGTLPAPGAVGTPGYFTEGNPGLGVPATIVRQHHLNSVAVELKTVVEAAGLTLSKTDNTQLLQAITKLNRLRLTANLTLFVATTGSDSTNTGLTSGSPFLTLQHAWNVLVANYDLCGFSVTISVANGTYNAGATCVGMPPGISSTNATTGNPSNCISFVGNVGSPSSVTVIVTNGNCFTTQAGAEINVSGFLLVASGSAGTYSAIGYGLCANDKGAIQFGTVSFGTCGSAHMNAATMGMISSNGSAYTIAGAAPSHISVALFGYVTTTSSTVTLTGQNFSVAFASAVGVAYLYAGGMTFVGSGTGSRYNVINNAVIQTGASITYFPGNAVGTTANGGLYV